MKSKGFPSENGPFWKIYSNSVVGSVIYDTSEHTSKMYFVYFVKMVKSQYEKIALQKAAIKNLL